MSTQMPYKPDEREQQVLDVLKEEGRANPWLIREKTDLRKQYVNDALRGLEKAELVEKVTRGLYAYAGSEPTGLSRDEVREVCSDLERGLETHEWSAVEDAATRLGCDLE